MARGDDDPVARARHLRLRARRRARRRGPQACGVGSRARRRRRAGARPRRSRVDRAPSSPVYELPRAGPPRAHRCARPRGIRRQAPLVRGQSAPDQARDRDRRTGVAGGGRRRGARVLALPAAPEPRQHHRGRHVGDPPQHHRRARPRPAAEPLMDFSFSPEQDMLRAHARSFLEKRFPAERVAELASSAGGWDRSSWKELAELGWTGASIPEAQGGAGLGFLEEAIVFEELGRALYPGPYFATVGLALPALVSTPDLLRQIASGTLTATLAWREPGRAVSLAAADAVATEARCVDGGWRLRGAKHLVPDAGAVDAFVVLARGPDGLGLFLAERRDGRPQVTVPDTVDATRRLGRVTFADDEATLLAGPP